MNLRKLKHLLAVIEHGSVRAASEQVHLSQPALSRSLSSLEHELGIALLDRTYGQIVQAAYAKPVIDHLRRICAEDRALRETIRRIKGLDEGEVRVGFGPFAAATALRPVMQEVMSSYPNLSFTLEIANTGLLLELLRQDRLDIVIGDSRYLDQPEGISIIALKHQTIAIAVQPEHELTASPPPLTLADLQTHTTGSPTLPDELAKQLRKHGLADFPTVTCDDMRVLVDLAERTELVVILPQLVVKERVRRGSLTTLELAMPFRPHTNPCIMHISGRMLGPASRLLIDLVSHWFNNQ